MGTAAAAAVGLDALGDEGGRGLMTAAAWAPSVALERLLRAEAISSPKPGTKR